ncbi:hypothetical protein [Corynebacterium lubricantis]|uniref:hypothetical protein n=1 Tax=Corynebacterium lubricantis TaxID=541095 RepID=UPI001FE1A0E3|nr:hypothetical protein [Corynebacterium lubricantis]
MSALLLASCSAGQITQTSGQVAAVDGATASTENQEVTVQDVHVILDPATGDAALKFTATNQDPSHTEHTLQSAEVAGEQVNLGNVEPLGYNCTLVADSAEGLDSIPQADPDTACIQYVEASVENKDFAYGGNQEVVFNFDSGQITLDVTVSAPNLEAGNVDRGPETNISDKQQEEQGGGH